MDDFTPQGTWRWVRSPGSHVSAGRVWDGPRAACEAEKTRANEYVKALGTAEELIQAELRLGPSPERVDQLKGQLERNWKQRAGVGAYIGRLEAELRRFDEDAEREQKRERYRTIVAAGEVADDWSITSGGMATKWGRP